MDTLAMNKLSYGLFVLSAKDRKQNACIINTAMQLTTSPNRISIAVNKANYTHDIIAATAEFNISVLSEKCDFKIFERFGFQSGRALDKFENFDGCKIADNGIAYITEGTNAVISAKLVNSIDLGTHTLFIADVVDAFVLSNAPSLTYAYYHANIKPKPAASAKTGKTVWRCTVCGYEEEIDELPDDFVCPICLHPKSDFEKIVN